MLYAIANDSAVVKDWIDGCLQVYIRQKQKWKE